MTTRLRNAQRIVVKIGSSLLVDEHCGALRQAWLDGVGADLAALWERGAEVIVVSSGAIAMGRRPLGLLSGKLKLEEKQAAAAAGQIRLAHAYQETMTRHGITVAQVLLTLGDTENRRSYLNGRNTLATLLRLKAMPVINENDAVATREIRYGDNDRLAARVAMMCGADALILLSDVDGLYTDDPKRNPSAVPIPEVRDLTPEIRAMAKDSGTSAGTGGMVTKLMAAQIAMGAGCAMAIASGRVSNPLARLEAEGPCTWFLPSSTPQTARKKWISGFLHPLGVIAIDGGAVHALRQGKSLLPAGVVSVSGSFDRGDPVAVVGPDGVPLGKGLTAYSARDAHAIQGRRSEEIETILGYSGREELIHRDDMALEG